MLMVKGWMFGHILESCFLITHLEQYRARGEASLTRHSRLQIYLRPYGYCQIKTPSNFQKVYKMYIWDIGNKQPSSDKAIEHNVIRILTVIVVELLL